MDNELALMNPDEDGKKINRLHLEAHAHAETAVKKAILCGQKLQEKKDSLQHGSWLPWVEKHLTFDERTAQRYLQIAANATRVSHLESVREAVKLLAEPREETSLANTPAGLSNDPETDRKLKDAESATKRAQEDLRKANREVAEKERELLKLRKLEADKARVEKALKELHELEERKQELFKDSESLRLATNVLVRSREFFTRECMQVAALRFRPGTVEAIKQDMAGLLDLVQNWLDAMHEKFGVERRGV